MDDLYLGDADMHIHLDGENITAPVLGCAYAAGSGAGDEVNDRLDLVLEGTETELRGVAEGLERIFQRARGWQAGGVMQQQWLAARCLPGESMWQSLLLDGWLEWGAPGAGGRMLGAGRLAVHLRRMNYFERQSAEQVLLANDNAPAGALTLNLYNCNDGAGASPSKRQNYAVISAGAILGDLPAPAWVTLSNRHNDADLPLRAWVGLVQSPFNAAQFTLDAESAAGGTNQADGSCSGGYKASCTLGTDAETDLLAWTLAGAAADLCGGRVFHLMGRFAATNSLANIKFRLKVRSGSTTVWAGQQFRLANPADLMHDLGLVRLPPDPGWDDQAVVVLSGQRTTGVSETIALDFMQLFGLDAFIQLEGLAGLAYLDALSFGGAEEHLRHYYYATGKNRLDWYAPGGRAVWLTPGAAQMLSLLVQTGSAGVAEIDRQTQLSVLYTPRRRAL